MLGLLATHVLNMRIALRGRETLHAIVYSLQSSVFGLYDLRNTRDDKNQFYFHAGNLTTLHVFIKIPFKLFCLCLSYLCVQ